ncbi:MAG: fumarate hydratase [Candidatus Brocadiaceae bacterium]|nr:fumarate hydratase [Candidatus Brocadiaceae bacterium]
MAEPAIIRAEAVAEATAGLYRRINTHLRADVRAALERAMERETAPVARDILAALLENERISRTEGVPLCQDTGLAVAFVRIGNRVVIEGGTVQAAIDAGIRRAAAEHPLRASTVRTPLGRANSGDNAPAIVHMEQCEGPHLTIDLLAKGGGAENMSRTFMLAPAAGREGVLDAVVETVRQAGANPCPPIIVGVGLGGNFERAALLAKRALLRDLDGPQPDAELAELEREALERVNRLGIGPQGLGGRTTALAVLFEQAPCHIASLPLAVNLECHSHRHGSVTIRGTRPGE